ncbi:ATP-grasp domain-containing protein [Rheinheimera sp. WS51]|uniref:ATP-grasp domain-containing protein n=1 Tax=Rheinheimera sp. WS51 TaxID=3425886 RepID=UPI003D8EED5A
MSSDTKHALVVGNVRAPHVILEKLGYRISWLCKRSLNYMHSMADNNRCQNIFNYSGDNQEQIIELAQLINKYDKVDVVVAFHDAAQLDAIAIAECLGLPFNYQPNTLHYTRNKDTMREVLKAHQLTELKQSMVADVEQLETFYQTYPEIDKIILKPVEGTGSEGVSIFARAQLAEQSTSPLEFPLLAEEYFSGQEFSVEGFSQKGKHYIIGITEKFKGEGTFVESGHLFPARLTDEDVKLVQEYVVNCLIALEVTEGITHSEVLLNEGRLEMIETHTRVGGDNISELVKLTTGVDLYYLQTHNALGEIIAEDKILPKPTGKHACIKFQFNIDVQGKIKAIEGIDEVKSWDNVIEADANYAVGAILPLTTQSLDRSAYAMVEAQDAHSALALADKAISTIKYTLE